jgi:ABC-type nitrate/sulfonate/bicarbonate transport system ATPase subunit
MTTPFLSVQGLTRRFPEATGKGELTVFEDLWFGVEEGEFACVIGHSGCGKSTILNIVAGLDKPTEGHVVAAGKHVEGPSLDRAVIFQGHAPMPWLTALGNVELAVSSRHPGWSRRHRLRRGATTEITPPAAAPWCGTARWSASAWRAAPACCASSRRSSSPAASS